MEATAGGDDELLCQRWLSWHNGALCGTDATKMKQAIQGRKEPAPTVARMLASAGLAALLWAPGLQYAAADTTKPCATASSLEGKSSASLVTSQSQDVVIAIRPDSPRVGRPVVAWIVGYQPGRLLIARRINWHFNNAVSVLKDSGGGTSSTIYLTPGTKTLSVTVTGLSGEKKTATCSFSVTW